MKWNQAQLEETLQALRARENIPASERRAAIRAQLVAPTGVYLYVVETHLGWIGVASSPQGIRSLVLPRSTRSDAQSALQHEFPDGVLRDDAPENIRGELREYSQGQCRRFALPVDLSAVRPFQRAVLTAISKIPFGQTRTYGWVAREIGQPRAARAVGQALHTNPIPIIIPCHRVVASDGGLGGYGGGLPMKIKLLQLEGATLA
jgi:methylated-DNA-[protein]-cysteine S-methyltransferase